MLEFSLFQSRVRRVRSSRQASDRPAGPHNIQTSFRALAPCGGQCQPAARPNSMIIRGIFARRAALLFLPDGLRSAEVVAREVTRGLGVSYVSAGTRVSFLFSIHHFFLMRALSGRGSDVIVFL